MAEIFYPLVKLDTKKKKKKNHKSFTGAFMAEYDENLVSCGKKPKKTHSSLSKFTFNLLRPLNSNPYHL